LKKISKLSKMLLHSTSFLPFSFNLSAKNAHFVSISDQNLPQKHSQDEPKSNTSSNTSNLLLPSNPIKADQSTNSLVNANSPIESINLSEISTQEISLSSKKIIIPDSEDYCVLGTEVWCGEAKYTGSFKDEMKHGYGVLQFRDGLHYKGQFQNDNISGYGVATWPEKIYEGHWKNNQKHGTGKESYADGRRYIGEFRNDKKEGYGEFYWHNGSSFKGFFSNGKQHGEGEFTSQNGGSKKGLWENGKRITWIEEKNKIVLHKLCLKEEISISSNTSLSEPKKKEHQEKENKVILQ